ncbi:MAG: hypothetical protein ACKOBV_07925 [Candidatus Kapaibacterium sp.]
MMVLSLPAMAQTLTNNGTVVYMAPKAVVVINGNAEVKSAGIVTMDDSASVRVNGNLQVSNGSVNMNRRSTVNVNGDVETGGVCSQPAGIVVRNGSGVLTVSGSVVNKGLINNNSTIFIGTTLKNDGEVNNSSGSLIEVGP